jgi:hypothetical protein
MLDPAGLYSNIMNRILDRVPGGDAFRPRTPETDENTEQAPVEANRDTPFGELVRHFGEAAVQAGDTATGSDVNERINAEITRAAERHNLDPELIRALIRAESDFRPDAVSHAGAMGLMQLMPGTAAHLGVTDPFDIAQNIDGGSRYLRRMLDMFDGNTSLALAAYNAGAGAVQRHGGIPPFAETQQFVPRVQSFWERNLLAQYQSATKFG